MVAQDLELGVQSVNTFEIEVCGVNIVQSLSLYWLQYFSDPIAERPPQFKERTQSIFFVLMKVIAKHCQKPM